jgi:hypothetical protein
MDVTYMNEEKRSFYDAGLLIHSAFPEYFIVLTHLIIWFLITAFA